MLDLDTDKKEKSLESSVFVFDLFCLVGGFRV